MIDEHTRVSLLHVVKRSITADRLIEELVHVFAAACGPSRVLRMDNGPELVSQALQKFCDGKVGLSYIPPGTPWNNGYIESFNNRPPTQPSHRCGQGNSQGGARCGVVNVAI
jgi:putative transposase